jgi:hypothetical protein
MEIKFYWNGSFAGTGYHMTVDGERIGLGYFDEAEAKLNAINILKNDYGVEYKFDDVIFNWGGEL